MRSVPKFFLGMLSLFLAAGCLAVPLPTPVSTSTPALATRTYAPSDAIFANPERGFYHYIETRASAPAAYHLATLQSYRLQEQITLLYCIHYLDEYLDSPIAEDFLAHITANLATVREAGLKCILRFAYTDDDPTVRNEEPPFGDADKDRILAHIAQLRPILQQNADVIALVQAGFIGVWGEWYYTDHFVDDPNDPSTISAEQHANRLEVLSALLDALPATHSVAVRYPHAKQAMLQSATPLTEASAYQATVVARTGYHNDCFLASETDFGTYRDDQIEADKNYLAVETAFVPMGGETCNPNPPRSLCPTALAEMERFHWSYANRDYHPEIYAGWRSDGCLDEMQRRLGYRLQLHEGEYSEATRPGDGLSVQITLSNRGFAAPYKPRPIHLILRATGEDGAIYQATLPDDLRRWLPGDSLYTLDYTIGIPDSIPPGEYELLLHLPDAAPDLQARPDYAIRLANSELWEANTGYNRLMHSVQIAADAPAAPYDGDLFFTARGEPSIHQHVAYLPFVAQ